MKRAVRQMLTGGGAQWRSTLATVRAFVTANYNQPNPHNQAAMASPPAIATSTTQPTGLTTEYRYTSNGSALTMTGGQNSQFSTYRRFPVATAAATGGNIGAGQQGISWRVGFIADAQKVGLRLLGSTSPFRFIVAGQYVDTAGTVTAASAGTNYVQLDFGTKAVREIWVEGELAHGFDGVALAPTDTISPVTPPKRIIFVGDSFTESTGSARNGDGFARVAADMLGFKDAWLSGVGSTGYVANSSNTRYTLGQRLQDVNATGPWDAIVVAMGTNDLNLAASAITPEVSLTLAAIRRANPAAQIFVVGGWDALAPAAPGAGYGTTKAAIRAGIPPGLGILPFIDPEAVGFTHADATHPDTAGHDTLGKWLALQIKTALGA